MAEAAEGASDGGNGGVHAPPQGEQDPPARPAEWSDVVACADQAFVLSSTWLLAPDRLHLNIRGLGLDPADPALAALRASMNFQLRESRGPQSDVTLTYFDLPGEPVLTPKRVAAETREGWRRLSAAVTHPAGRARLHDLLWQGGGPGALADCTAALDAYLQVATLEPYRVETAESEASSEENVLTVHWQSHDRDLALGRALAISHVASHTEAGAKSAARAREIALARVDDYLGDARPNAGNALMLLAQLVRHRRLLSDEQRFSLHALVEAALRKYAPQDHLVDELAEMLVRLLPSQRPRAQRLRVEARLAIADDPQPAVKMHFLEQAASLARDFRIDELEAEATRRMQAIKPEDLGFQVVSSEIEIPRETVRAELSRMSQGATWRESLHSWLLTPSPTGSAEGNQRTAELVNAGSLRRMLGMPTVVFGPDGLPSWTAQSEADQRAWELVGVERTHLTFSGQLLADALDRIAASHTAPEEGELTAFLAKEGTGDAELAAAMARAMLRFWRGDYEGSLHTAIPRIEAGARRVVLALDEPAYQVARGAQPGKYVGLPSLLDVLAQQDFDPDWDRFLRTFLLGPAGLNGRHDLAHGFNLHRRPRVDAALALRALGLFVAMPFPADDGKRPTLPPTRPLLASSITEAVSNFARLSVGRRVPVRVLIAHEGRSAILAGRTAVAALGRLLR